MRRASDIYDRTEKLLLNDKTKAIAGFNEVIIAIYIICSKIISAW